MDRRLAFFASIAGILLGIIGVFFLLGVVRPKTSGISIETSIPTAVFIDGRQVGRTPYDGTLSPHTTVVKLVPYDQNMPSYETRVDLVAGIKTIIRRNFAQTEAASSGQIISFEKTPTEDFGVSIITSPDAAQVILDGRPRGFTPIRVSQLGLGSHQLSLSAPGYADSTFSVKTVDGYRLVVIAKLAQTEQGTLGVQTQAQQDQGPDVEILRSSTQFLKVREAPSTASNEVGQVNAGDKYKLISKSSDLSWYEIDLGAGKSGWILAQYATVSGTLK